MPHADHVLAQLDRAGLQLAVVSNSDSRIRQVIKEFDLEEKFPAEAIFLSSECGSAKPNIQMFRKMGSVLSVEASQTMHVGNSVQKDYKPAKLIGMHPILLSDSPNKEVPEDHRISSFAKLLIKWYD